MISRIALGGCVLLWCLGSLQAADDSQGSFESNLYPPDWIVQHRDRIDLTDEQLARIRGLAESAGRQISQLEQNVRHAQQAMKQVLRGETIDEAESLKQLDVLLEAERNMKRMHVQAMVRIRNVLTAEQIQVLAKLHPLQHDPAKRQELEKRLRRKVAQIQREVERRAENGVPPLEAVRIMAGFQEQMQTGRPHLAEAILDRVMKMLEVAESDSAVQSTPEDQSDARRAAPQALTGVPVMERLSQSEVEKRIASWEVPDVAWRKIDWQPCLLAGLQMSKSQRRPIIAWVFIDRPIDDERC